MTIRPMEPLLPPKHEGLVGVAVTWTLQPMITFFVSTKTLPHPSVIVTLITQLEGKVAEGGVNVVVWALLGEKFPMQEADQAMVKEPAL